MGSDLYMNPPREPMRREYGVRRFGGQTEAKISKHVAEYTVEQLREAGEKNVWLVVRDVSDWRASA